MKAIFVAYNQAYYEEIISIVNMHITHIQQGLITKEFAKQSIKAYISGIVTSGSSEAEQNCNNIINYLSNWAELYIDGVSL